MLTRGGSDGGRTAGRTRIAYENSADDGGDRRSGERGQGERALALALAAGSALGAGIALFGSDGQLFALANFDLFAEFLPRHHYAASALRAGRIPLWDPHQAAGLPFLATLQGGVLYPPNALYALLPIPLGMAVLALLHVAATAAATFGLARELGASRPGAALAGVAFALSASTLFLALHTNAINAVPWLPAALFGAARLARAPGPRGALLLGAVLALQVLAGRPYLSVLTAHALALFAAFQLGWLWRDGAGAGRLLRHVLWLAAGGALALGLAAVQILPTWELLGAGLRGLAGPARAGPETFGPFPPALFLANLVHPLAGALRREYLGWIPLGCFLVALGRVHRDRVAAFAATLALVAALLCFGSQTPLYAAYRWLPGGAAFRLPDRLVVLFALAGALGAARGLDALRVRGSRAEVARRLAVFAAFGAGLAGLLATGALEAGLERAQRPWSWSWLYAIPAGHFDRLPAALLAWVAVGGLLFAVGRAPRRAGGLLRAALPGLAALELVLVLTSPLAHPARAARHAYPAASCYAAVRHRSGPHGRHLTLRPQDGVALRDKDGELYGGFAATHYDPLVTRRHAAYLEALEAGGVPLAGPETRGPFMGFLTRIPSDQRLRLLDLLGVRALLADGRRARRPPALAAFLSHFERRGGCRVPTAAGAAPVELYANPRALPRAFVVGRVHAVPDAAAALRRVLAPDFDPRREAAVEGGTALARRLDADAPLAASATLTAYAAERVAVRVETPRPGLLVVTDAFDPGWRAERDGEPVAIHPTDALFRGVAVPAGRSEVVFRYAPRPFRAGLAISTLALVVLIGGLAGTRRGGPALRSRDG